MTDALSPRATPRKANLWGRLKALVGACPRSAAEVDDYGPCDQQVRDYKGPPLAPCNCGCGEPQFDSWAWGWGCYVACFNDEHEGDFHLTWDEGTPERAAAVWNRFAATGAIDANDERYESISQAVTHV